MFLDLVIRHTEWRVTEWLLRRDRKLRMIYRICKVKEPALVRTRDDLDVILDKSDWYLRSETDERMRSVGPGGGMEIRSRASITDGSKDELRLPNDDGAYP